MKVTTKNIENYEQEITVEFEWAEVEKNKKKAVKLLAERVNIPGFRKGKAPIQKIEQYYGKGAVLEEAADILMRKGANDCIKTYNLFPVTQMVPKIITCEEGKDLVFTLTYTPYPEVKLGDYKGIEIEKVVEPVTDEDVDKRLNEMRDHHANLIDAEEGGSVADGDFITLNFVGTVDGEKFEGGEAEDYPLTIGSHSFIDNFEDQLIGAKVGEEREVHVTFPEDYHVKDLADKPAVFKCKINSIKHKELPALDDEFAKKASKFETLDELKADVRKNLESTAERRAVHSQQDKVIDTAVKNMTVDIPPVMIEERITVLIKEFESRLQMQGMKLEQYMSISGTDMDKMREEYRETAKESLLIDMLLDEVAKVEDIKVEDNELNTEIAYMSMIYRTNPKELIKVLRETKQLQNVYATVLHRKARDLIIQNSNAAEKVEETSADSKSADSATEEKNQPVEQNLFEETKE
ncbi:MAG: trigger factor [Selenomonadaceae bacterium]|nr:trigger factor [Selenomonadaceae bacterium]